MIIVPAVAENYLLDELLDRVTPYFHLYTSEMELGEKTVKEDFQEADWPDYKAAKVTTWSPALQVCGRAVSTADSTRWDRGEGGEPREVFGYFVTDGPDGKLLWCEQRDKGPLRMEFPSDYLVILPRITLREDPDEECKERTIKGQGDLVGDGMGAAVVPLTVGVGDLVGDGVGGAGPILLTGTGDLVGDGIGVAATGATGTGDLVGDGDGEATTGEVGIGELVGDGAGVAVGGLAGGGDLIGYGDGTFPTPSGSVEFTTAGGHTWTWPSGITTATVEVWGGGGGAQTGTIPKRSGGGGGYSRKAATGLPGNNESITVGGGGAVANPGGDSWFRSSSFCLAKGGTNGTGSVAGTGGQASAGIGDLKTSGGNGHVGGAGAEDAGGGGGSGGSGGNGGDGGIGTAGAAGLGGGAAGGTGGSGGAPGTVGNPPGGGGGGANAAGGGRGGAVGKVKITWP